MWETNDLFYILTNFGPMPSFYTPWKQQKTKVFSGGIKWEHWLDLSLWEKYLRKEHIVIKVIVSNIFFEDI